MAALAVLFAGLFCFQAHARVRGYKYYLDANQAEQILANITLRPRLSDKAWLGILKGRSVASITIVPGDNLWNISRRAFKNPFLWRKLWEQNEALLFNPHELTPGQILKYYQNDDDEENVIRIPLIHLMPGLTGVGADIDNDTVINPDIKNKYRPLLMMVTEQDVLGRFTGSYAPTRGIQETDKVYLKFQDPTRAKVGEKYAVVEIEKRVSRSVNGESIEGLVVRVTGIVQVIHIGQKLAQASVSEVFNPLYRGSLIIPAPKAVQWSAAFNPPEGLKPKVVAGEEEDYRHFGQGQILLLDKGESDGMKIGFMFRIYRDTDPVLDDTDVVEPDFKGEVQIIQTGKLSSIGFILRNDDAITIGDILYPAQDFPSPPPPAVISHDVIEIPD